MGPSPRGTLTLVGLGRRPDADPTLDALDALSRADAVFAVALSPQAGRRVRALAGDVREFARADDPRARAALRRELARGRSVAWACMGHPAEDAPPPAAWEGASFRVAKGLCALDSRLARHVEPLAYRAAYYAPDGECGPPRRNLESYVLIRADWPARAAARRTLARRLAAQGRRALEREAVEEAFRLLDEASAMAPDDPRILESMGRVRLRRGQPMEAWRCFWEAVVLGAPRARLRAPLDQALRALGRPGETWAARRRKPRRGAGASARERARALAARGDLEGARAAYDRAVAAEPSAEVFAERGRWAARHGLPMENVADFREALDLEPTVARRLDYAHALRHAKMHGAARAEFDRAARTPGAPAEAFRLRGLARLRRGDWRGALADAAAARRRGASARDLLLLRAEAAAASRTPRRRLRDALAEAGPSDRAWLEGYLGLAEGRTDPAPFERSLALAGGTDEWARRRGRAYAALARAWDWCPPPKGGPRLVLCGMGVAPPLSPTVEAVAALRACDVVFQNSSSDPLSPLLRLLCRDVRRSTFRGEHCAPGLVEEMLAEVRKGRVVGFATFGHPLLFGPLALAAASRARREKVEVTVCAAPSSLGEMLSAGARLGPVPAAQVLVGIAEDAERDAPRVDPAAPLLLYPEPGPGSTPALLKKVVARYPPGHRAFVLAPGEKDWDQVQDKTLDEVAALPLPSLKQRLVFVPAARA